SQRWYQWASVRKGWKPPCYERFIKIVREMEAKGGKKFPTGKDDDAPYPFHPKTIPKDWNWRTVWGLFTERASTMRNYCNRKSLCLFYPPKRYLQILGKWATVDNAETLYLECLWQRACGSGEKYKEFFGLPLTVFIRHPLRFSIGHRVHV